MTLRLQRNLGAEFDLYDREEVDRGEWRKIM
jgi:hypothetical protein